MRRSGRLCASRVDRLRTLRYVAAVTAGILEISADSVDRLLGDVSWWGGFIRFESPALDAVILGGRPRSYSRRVSETPFGRLEAALVQKIRIEDDILRQYRLPGPTIEDLIEALEAAIAR